MARTRRWDGNGAQSFPATSGGSFTLTELAPGETLLRTFLWITGWAEYTSFASMSGTLYGAGVVMGPSVLTPPAFDPTVGFATVGDNSWIMTTYPMFTRYYSVPGTSPQEYVDVTDPQTEPLESQAQRTNRTGSSQGVWLILKNDDGSYPGSIVFNVVGRVLVEEAP
jgi:hypothetical protein